MRISTVEIQSRLPSKPRKDHHEKGEIFKMVLDKEIRKLKEADKDGYREKSRWKDS